MRKEQIIKVIACFMNGEPVPDRLDQKEYVLLLEAYEAVKDLNKKSPIMMKRPMLGYLTEEGIISVEEGAKLFGCTCDNAKMCRMEYSEIKWKKEQEEKKKMKKVTKNIMEKRCASGVMFLGTYEHESFWRGDSL